MTGKIRKRVKKPKSNKTCETVFKSFQEWKKVINKANVDTVFDRFNHVFCQ